MRKREGGVSEEYVRLASFPFPLNDYANIWFNGLASDSIATWAQMQRTFLQNYYPASLTASVRKDISSIKQFNNKTLYEYWERFRRMCVSCP